MTAVMTHPNELLPPTAGDRLLPARPTIGLTDHHRRVGALPAALRAPGEEGRGDGLRRREEAAVRRPPARVDDGGPFPVRADPLEEAQRSNVSLAMMSRWIWLVPS